MDRRSPCQTAVSSSPGLLTLALAATNLAPSALLAQDSTSQGQNQLEEIVVTATKSASGTDVAKVPISITAFDQDMIETLNAKDFSALAARTPGVVLTDVQTFGLALTNIQIRGISSRTSEPTT